MLFSRTNSVSYLVLSEVPSVSSTTSARASCRFCNRSNERGV